MIDLLEKHRIIPLILTILAAIEIFFFSGIISAPGKKGFIPFSVIYHFIIFFCQFSDKPPEFVSHFLYAKHLDIITGL